MKISEFSTDKAANVLCEVSVYALNICEDEQLIGMIREKIEGAETQAELYTATIKKLSSLIPLLLDKHKQDVYGILATIYESNIETIAQQNILITMRQIKEIFQDKDLMDFFTSSM